MDLDNIAQQRATQYENMLRLIGRQRAPSEEAAPALAATRMRSVVNCDRIAEAYRADAKVAYVSEQFPTEIVFAAGVLPWNIESMSNMLAQSLDIDQVFRLTQERELSRDICSFLRGPFGMMLAECYPRPDFVLTNDQPCEGLLKTIFMSGKRYGVPTFALHTPNLLDQDVLDYLVQQIEIMLTRIAGVFQSDPDPEFLRSSIVNSNRAREYYRKAALLLERHALPGVARELLEIFGMNYFGAPENIDLCKTLYEEAVVLAETGAPKRPRVMWIGQTPGESDELLRHLGRSVDVLYWAPLWEANLVALDEEQPLRSIAERAIRYHWNAERMERDLDHISDAYQVEGYIIANTWGCRNMMAIGPTFRSLAARKRIKNLTISIDPVDRNNYAFPHIKNRVDAFLETLQ
ncbi:2-hydroxyacyl-CoA dehydratase family protein [Rhodopseudomonas palustris]|uniref:2-hydroxyglutaryl-CoA dehydratase, D-component n=1 Tax=Rhodopseudomonas palustris (strain BisB18) TaxID=316056 RepID=Q216S5_RHOPB